MAGQPCKSDIQLLNFKVNSEIQICPAGIEIDLANEVLDLRDLTERYWRIIQAQHVKIARLQSELCAQIARR